MLIMNPVVIAIAKDVYGRLYFWGQTLLELLIPVATIMLMNLTTFPMPEPPNHEFTNDTIYRTCDSTEADIFTGVLYEPSNKFTDALMSNVKCLGRFHDVKPGDIDKIDLPFIVGVSFKKTDFTNSLVPDSLDYELFPTRNYWDQPLELWWDPAQYRTGYTSEPLKKFLRLMHAIDESFMRLKNISTSQISFQNMDMLSRSPRFHKLVVLGSFFFGFLFMVPSVVGRVVQTKSSGVKEIVLMMGLKKWHLWAGKLFDCVLLSGTSVLLMLIFLYVPLTKHSQVLREVRFCLMGTYLYFALFEIFVFLCFMSCLFNNPMVAVLTTQIVWAISFLSFLVMSVFSSKVSFALWMICCLIPHFSFFTGLSIILDFDYYGKELNAYEILSTNLGYPTFYNVTVMIFIGTIFYLLLGLYLEEVIPGKFGIPKPYDFFLKRSFWFPVKKNMEDVNPLPDRGNENVDFEPVPEGLDVGISIRNLKKEYKTLTGNSVMAVDNVSIDFYSGEISALLGHNGAGKTTVFSAISGLTTATSGQILINGYDVAENTDEARKSFGYCPQHDMLFEELTPFDNLRFFAMAKGLGVCDAPLEATKIIRQMKLSSVGNNLVRKLSGGQKRKLSLGIALIGGSDVVVLDEPTSGLDPEMRREIWEILLALKGSKTILLTTHSMEEADVLSDRIAIMEHGKIKCYGTSMYLKSKYGSGYTLSVVIKNMEKVANMTQYVQSFVKSARLMRQNVFTLTFKLPEEEMACFARLFAGLNRMQETRQIQSFSMDFSTFEDVFIRLRGTENEDTRIDVIDHSEYKKLNTSEESKPAKVNDYMLPFLQFYGLLIKKCVYFSRNIGSFLLFTAVALAFVMASFLIVPSIMDKTPKLSGHNETFGKGILTYSLESYAPSKVFYTIDAKNKFSRAFVGYLEKYGWKAKRVESIQEEVEEIYQEDFYMYMKRVLMGAEFDEENNVKLFHNSLAVHMLPIGLNVLYNSLLSANNVSGAITTSVNLKYTDRESKKIVTLLGNTESSSKCSIADIPDFIGIQMLFYLIGPIREKSLGAKHLQLMTTSGALYWLSHLLFDSATLVVYLSFPTLIVGLSTSDETFFAHKEEIFFGLVLWSIGLLLFTYIITTFVTKLGLASVTYLTVYFIFTFVVYILVEYNLWPSAIQYFHPSTILKMGFSNICAAKGEDIHNHYMLALTLYNILLFGFLVLKDSHLVTDFIHQTLTRMGEIDYKEPVEKDTEVKDQEELVKTLKTNVDLGGNTLIVDGLKRWHYNACKRTPTVKGVSFTVKTGECFGLLGVNGAGKTTSFKMMTGEVPASQGRVYVNGHNVFKPRERSRALYEIGYCPQHGGFIPTLKGRELLALFARLRGIQESQVNREAMKWVQELDLMEYADTTIDKYSGGNQRKLAAGLALIGNPPAIFLDEPTIGVDPVTRRVLWKAIGNLRAQGKSILFTSHSMDECETICTRLAIMVRGSFRCLGEITTLKDTFGQGYTVQLKITLGASPEDVMAIKRAMCNEFDPGCDLIDEHLTILHYHILNRSLKWDALFMKLIRMRETFSKLESFNASSTTLEQIFINFAKKK